MIIQISAGQGPAECQRAVARLLESLKRECGDMRVLSDTAGSEKGCLDSVRFQTKQDLSELEGTVLWICKSPYRKNCRRKNWYVDVSVIPEQEEIASEQEYRIEKFHCGGKGGQHVNKVETGVRITHIPTGITAQSTEERSQFQNRRKAMEKLGRRLKELRAEQEEKQSNIAWRKHNRIVRGNPVRIYEGEKFVRRE